MAKKQPTVAMWQGFGIISPKGMFLEAWSSNSEYVLQKLQFAPKGSKLIMVTARLEHITKPQFRKTGDLQLGFVLPEKPSRKPRPPRKGSSK